MLRSGDKIEYLADVSSPPSQKGFKGQTKIIDRDITLWAAKFLLDGGLIRLFVPAPPLQLEEKETKKSPDVPAEIPGPGVPGSGAPGPDSEVSTKVKKERRTKTNGQRKSNSERNQTGDSGPKKPDPKRRAGSRGD